MQNILTVDFEDWYQTHSYNTRVKISDWGLLENRLAVTLKILDTLNEFNIKATFFIVAYNIRNSLSIIRRIIKEGHEIGLHGYYHNLVYRQSPLEFRKEVEYSKCLLEDLSQKKIVSFRAPNWSITPSCLWALEVLTELGFRYDSSMHDSLFEKISYKIPLGLREIPRPSFNLANFSVPFAGGIFFRAYPYCLTKKLIHQKNNRNQRVVVYIHPWEFDDVNHEIKLGFPYEFIQNFGLKYTKEKFKSLLSDFNFSSIEDVFLDETLDKKR